MKPSLVLSRDVNVRHGSDRAYLAGEHGFDPSSHLTGRRGLLTRPRFFFVPTTKPSKSPTRMSPSLAAFSWIRYRVCAFAASVLPLRTCQERTAVHIGRRQHRTALHPGPAEHPPYPRSNQCLALARARRQASGLMSMPKTHPAPPTCSFARLGQVANVTDVRLAVSDSRGYRSRAHRS
jgi:hypothetical protein